MLQQILDRAQARLAGLIPDLDAWDERAASAPPPLRFDQALSATGLGVIAEVKRRSPSAGPIAEELDPVELAASYAAGGAAAISVLTDEEHFGGSLDDLTAARHAVSVPLLRKDFILHPVQVAEGRAAGADSVLLIVAALDDQMLASLIARSLGLGMVPLVEVHDATEMARAVAAGATVIGVNNRDLGTFTVDLATAERLRALVPAGIVTVAESGITNVGDARRMLDVGYDAVLVGQAAASAPDPAGFVRGLGALR